MHEHLERVSADLNLPLPAIAAAADHTGLALAEAREYALRHLVENDVIKGEGDALELGLVAFGSLAREEASSNESDFDNAVLAYLTVDTPEHIQQYRRAAVEVCRKTGLKEPGASRVFGGLISGSELINKIGLDDDTNRTHTQRMLFLEESVPIIGITQHRQTVKAILRRYLVDYRRPGGSKAGIPRFLLNDVVRYWRTIAVDYQAKRWDELNPFETNGSDDERSPKWGMRYIKLRSTRKLAFCGSLAALFMPRLLGVEVTDELLADQFEVPSLARLAQLAEFLDDEDKKSLREILHWANWFAERFGDGDFRSEVNQVEQPRDPDNNRAFQEAREATDQLQIALERLFQSTRPLAVPDPAGVKGRDDPICMSQITGRYLLF